MLLERSRNGRLSRRRETSEPDGEAGLLAVRVALGAREGRMPGDVAVGVQYTSCLRLGPQDGGMVGFGGALTLPFCGVLKRIGVLMRRNVEAN